jgi:hypothetical protein
MPNRSATALKIVLLLIGVYGLFISIDFGFGGFVSLGWQGTTEMVEITNPMRYGVQDNHFRFLGGVFSLVSAFMIFAVTDLRKYRQILNFCFALIVVGGLTRFTAGDFGILFSPDISVALFFEIVVIGGVSFWLGRVAQPV